MAYFRTDYTTFLLKFKNTTSKFICTTPLCVVKCLAENDFHNGLESIKVFNPSKDKFMRESKTSLFNKLVWCAETTEYFSKHYFFKHR